MAASGVGSVRLSAQVAATPSGIGAVRLSARIVQARAAAVASASTVTAARGIVRGRASAVSSASSAIAAGSIRRGRTAVVAASSTATATASVRRSRAAAVVTSSSVTAAWTAPPAPSALTPHYGTGPGKIAIHLDADSVTKDGSGNVTAFQNKGGAGAMFNATVVGTPVPLNGKTLALAGSATGTPELATSASLIDVRLMWVSTITATNGMRFFGDLDAAGGTDDYEIRLNVSGSDFAFQLWDNEGGVGAAVMAAPRVPAPAGGLHLFEIGVDQATGLVKTYMDGAQIGQTSWAGAFNNFFIRRIGQGTGTGAQFVGQMGDILGVTLGSGADEAIAAARAYLNDRFTLGLSQPTTYARSAAVASASVATAGRSITRRRAAAVTGTSAVSASAQVRRTVQSTGSVAAASVATAGRAVVRNRASGPVSASAATATATITRRRSASLTAVSSVSASAQGLRTVQSSAAVTSASSATASRTIRRNRGGAVQAASIAAAGRAITRGRAASLLAVSLVAANSGTSTTHQRSAAIAASSTATATPRRIIVRAVTVVSGSTVQAFRDLSRNRAAEVSASSQAQAGRTVAMNRGAVVVGASSVTALATVQLLTSRYAYPGEVRGGIIIHRHSQGG